MRTHALVRACAISGFAVGPAAVQDPTLQTLAYAPAKMHVYFPKGLKLNVSIQMEEEERAA